MELYSDHSGKPLEKCKQERGLLKMYSLKMNLWLFVENRHGGLGMQAGRSDQDCYGPQVNMVLIYTRASRV